MPGIHVATGNKSNEVVRLNGNVVKEILEESGVEQDILAAKMTSPKRAVTKGAKKDILVVEVAWKMKAALR